MNSKKSLPHAEQGRELLAQHFTYEVEMLRFTLFVSTVANVTTREVGYAMIESFCVHARNLIDFLCDTPRIRNSGYAAAIHFAMPEYHRTLPKHLKEGKAYPNLSEQVAHLTYSRANPSIEKIGPEDRRALAALIEKEIERFGRLLRAEYRGLPRVLLPPGI